MRAALLGLLLGSACGPGLIDACADRRASETTCVNLVLQGDLGDLSLLDVTTSGAWPGHAEAPSEAPFRLPATLGVALPATIRGAVRLEVRAYLGRRLAGQGAVVLSDLGPGEHREQELTLDRAAPAP